MTPRGFQIVQGTQGNWPADWQAVGATSTRPGSIASGGEAVIGPIDWVPGGFPGESVLAVTANPQDPAIVDNPQIAGSTIPNWRLVPMDNNIVQRIF